MDFEIKSIQDLSIYDHQTVEAVNDVFNRRKDLIALLSHDASTDHGGDRDGGHDGSSSRVGNSFVYGGISYGGGSGGSGHSSPIRGTEHAVVATDIIIFAIIIVS